MNIYALMLKGLNTEEKVYGLLPLPVLLFLLLSLKLAFIRASKKLLRVPLNRIADTTVQSAGVSIGS
jgi:hypothetical protein